MTIQRIQDQHYSELAERNGITHRLSQPEKQVALRLDKLGYTDWTAQLRVGKYRIDFAFEPERIALEVDGWHHGNPQNAARDQERDAWLRSQGWIILRISAGDTMREELHRVLEIVTAMRRPQPTVTSCTRPHAQQHFLGDRL